MHADVVVVGAGPAGSFAALVLARAGLDVALVDRARFPRDKTCGDGLMPDAINALRAVGLADAVLAEALRCHTLTLFSPNGTAVPITGDFAVLPRERLDACLCDAAVGAGARLMAPVQVEGPLEEGGRVAGVRGRSREGEPFVVRANVTVLATGAGAGPLKAFSMCERSQPSATAARFYVTVDGTGLTPCATDRSATDPSGHRAAHDTLYISYDRSICPGYGWLFPGPGGTFNVGVGYFYDAPALPAITNLRHLMARFLETFGPARELMNAGARVSELRGAPLRTGLGGSRLSRPGLLVVGDAAGLTYPISGEGIGKAMESGMLAAEIVCDARGTDPSARYADTLRARFASRFGAYASAQRWVARPRMVDFLAWRANRGTYVRRQIEGLVNETSDPRDILSARGILRSVFS